MTEESNMQEEKDTRGQWFVIQTLSGKENKVRDALQRQLDSEDAKDIPVYEVSIPTEKVSEVRQGKKYTTTRKIYIQLIWNVHDAKYACVPTCNTCFFLNVQEYCVSLSSKYNYDVCTLYIQMLLFHAP